MQKNGAHSGLIRGRGEVRIAVVISGMCGGQILYDHCAGHSVLRYVNVTRQPIMQSFLSDVMRHVPTYVCAIVKVRVLIVLPLLRITGWQLLLFAAG